MKYNRGFLKKGFFLFILMGLLFTQYQNCSSYSDPSPFEYPSTGDDGLSNPNQIALKALADSNGETITATGTCSAGIYSKSHVELQIFSVTGNPITFTAPCDHGRFHFIANARYFCNGVRGPLNLTMKGQLVIDDTKAKDNRPAEGSSNNGIRLNCL